MNGKKEQIPGNPPAPGDGRIQELQGPTGGPWTQLCLGFLSVPAGHCRTAGASWVHPLYQVGWICCVACGGQSHAPQAFPISTFPPRRLALLMRWPCVQFWPICEQEQVEHIWAGCKACRLPLSLGQDPVTPWVVAARQPGPTDDVDLGPPPTMGFM